MTALKEKAKKLGLRGIVARWDEYENEPWLKTLLSAEEETRAALAFERRIRGAHIGQFKPMSTFDWNWPEKIDREQVEDLFNLEFMRDKANVVLIGTNGLGKNNDCTEPGAHRTYEGHYHSLRQRQRHAQRTCRV